MNSLRRTGFTLIELLIVVAIIAILAAIAVPNFLEAQTRAKVSRVRADMRSMATALETYHIDNNTFIFQNPQYRALRINNGQPLVLENLTTPISYLNSVMAFVDPFNADKIYIGASLPSPPVAGPPPSNVANYKAFQLYKYYARNSTTAAIGGRDGDEKPRWYIIGSSGPDRAVENLNDPLSNGPNVESAALAFYSNTTAYNATNGTISRGSLYRVGGTPIGKGKAFYTVTQNNQ